MTRSARTTEAQRPKRALVRNMSGAAATAPPEAPEVILEARPALDFLVSLMLDTDSELLPADRAWYDASRASLSDALRRDLARVLGDDVKGICGAIVPLVIEDPAVRSSADVVALAGRIDPRDLLDTFSDGDDMKAAIALARRVLDGEREERDRAVSPLAGGAASRHRPPPRRSRPRAPGPAPRPPGVARALRADRGPRGAHGGTRRRRAARRSRAPPPRRLRGADDGRGSLGPRAGHAPPLPEPELLHAALQLHLRRPRLAHVRLPARRVRPRRRRRRGAGRQRSPLQGPGRREPAADPPLPRRRAIST